MKPNIDPVTFLLAASLLLGTVNVIAQTESEWEFAKGDDQVKVYYRTLPTGNVEFKGITTVNTSVSSLVSLFRDLENMPNWVYRARQVTELREVSNKERYMYAIHPMPFPFRDRDSVILSKIEEDPVTHEVTILGKGVPGYIPENSEYVRVEAIKSFWQFHPVDDKQVRITFQGYGEPGGSIPSSIYRSQVFRWLVEMYLWRLPYTTLSNLRTEVLKTRYQSESDTSTK